jgi:hypothetical protein
MDSYDKLMLLLVEEKENDVIDQDEQLAILVALLQIQSYDLRNALPLVEVTILGEERAGNNKGWRVMPCYTPTILLTMHQLAEREFRR